MTQLIDLTASIYILFGLAKTYKATHYTGEIDRIRNLNE